MRLVRHLLVSWGVCWNALACPEVGTIATVPSFRCLGTSLDSYLYGWVGASYLALLWAYQPVSVNV